MNTDTMIYEDIYNFMKPSSFAPIPKAKVGGLGFLGGRRWGPTGCSSGRRPGQGLPPPGPAQHCHPRRGWGGENGTPQLCEGICILKGAQFTREHKKA